MTSYQSLETRLVTSLALTRRPVALTICEQAPAGVERFSGIAPSGCSFWRLAADGRSFYTEAADHYNCAIGCYTHNIPLPPERLPELDATVAFMTGIGYLKPEDIPGIVRLPRPPQYVAYTPLAESPIPPEVVIVAGKPGKVMLLEEAALRAGVRTQPSLFARPTCMAIPNAIANGTTASAGCVGNRVYTGLNDDELYVMLPGGDLSAVVDALETIVAANAQLSEYHHARRAQMLDLGGQAQEADPAA